MRSVCKRMDAMCGSHLNLGFRNAEKYHTQLMKKFKSRKVGRIHIHQLSNFPLWQHPLLAPSTRVVNGA